MSPLHTTKIRRRLSVAAAAVLLATLSACAESNTSSVDPDDEIVADPTVTATSNSDAFPAGSSVAALKDRDKIVFGVKFDQPGLGEKDPATGNVTGFDIEIAKLIAAELGIENIEYKETISSNREPFLQNGTVDFVVASYSITDDRRKVVSQAGPYYLTGQQLLVRKDDSSISGPDQLSGKKVCSVTGSTSIKTVQEKYGAQPAPFGTYTECVTQLLNKAVDAVTTDGAVLQGYAARQPDQLKIVGEPFSEERYGVGFKFGDRDMCAFVTEMLKEAFQNGAWAQAYTDTLGKSGNPTPTPPTVDTTCSA
ncbi:MAG: glutamate ABC transporter substrate-binding protein [Sporichthyaceae bacterium]